MKDSETIKAWNNLMHEADEIGFKLGFYNDAIVVSNSNETKSRRFENIAEATSYVFGLADSGAFY